MNLPFLLGVGSLEIEERRPRSATEPRVKRLYFAKNRRHVTDDRYRGRRGFSNDWAMVPYDYSQRRQDQIEEWDRKKAAAQLHFDDREFRHQQRLNGLQLQHDEQRYHRRALEARQLNEIILHGQQIPPQYWQRMQEMQRIQDMQRMQGHGAHQMQGPGQQHQLPLAPPDHGRPDPRIMPIGPGGGHHGGHDGPSSEDESETPELDGHHGDGHHDDNRRRGRSGRRDHHDNFARGAGHGGRRRHGEQDDDIVRIESDSEDDRPDGRPPRRITGGHYQRLPREFRRQSRSRSRAHRSHSRPRNHSRMSPRRRLSRHRQVYYSDDSDTESDYEHIRIIRPRSRGSLRRERGQSRHNEDYSSDDSFAHYTRRPHFRLGSSSRRPRSRY